MIHLFTIQLYASTPFSFTIQPYPVMEKQEPHNLSIRVAQDVTLDNIRNAIINDPRYQIQDPSSVTVTINPHNPDLVDIDWKAPDPSKPVFISTRIPNDPDPSKT